MKTVIKKVLAGLLMVPILALGVSVIGDGGAIAFAATTTETINSGITATGQSDDTSLATIIRNIINALLWFIGIIGVIMLIVGGIRYILSAGNSAQVTAAKNTILYALIGIVIAVLALVIVNFVIDLPTSGAGAAGSAS